MDSPAITRALYFGCARGIGGRNEVGHYLYETVRGRLKSVGVLQPWAHDGYDGLDGTLAPHPRGRHSEAPQGMATLHHKDGWTALAFWDRTGDSRGASNSVFLFDAALDFDQALDAAREHFPALFDRFDFEVRPYPSGALV